MSKCYGTLISDKGRSTKTGNECMRASAQTWHGSLIAVARELKSGTVFEIEIADISDTHGEIIFSGTLDELKEKLS